MSTALHGAYERLASCFVVDHRVLILGIDAAGKTALLYRLQLGELVTTIPTTGFNVETIRHNNVTMTMWDVSGNIGIRPLWRHYFENTEAIVLVVDATDRLRLPEAKAALHTLYTSPVLHDTILLVLANKHDKDGAMSGAEMQLELELDSIAARAMTVLETSITEGTGVDAAMQWLTEELVHRGRTEQDQAPPPTQ